MINDWPRRPEILYPECLCFDPFDEGDMSTYMLRTKHSTNRECEDIEQNAFEIIRWTNIMIESSRSVRRSIKRITTSADLSDENIGRLTELVRERNLLFDEISTLARYLTKAPFGRYFPRTRRKLKRKVIWALSHWNSLEVDNDSSKSANLNMKPSNKNLDEIGQVNRHAYFATKYPRRNRSRHTSSTTT